MTQILDRYDTILSDLDGCLISGETVLPGAYELVKLYGERLFIVSNNSTDTPDSLSQKLAKLGLKIPAARIILAGTVSVDFIAKSYPGYRVDMNAVDVIKDYAKSLGIVQERNKPDLVFLARNTQFCYADLARLAKHAHQDIPFIVSNIDDTHPAPDGSPIPETGALLAAVKACCPKLPYISVGKPSPRLMQYALDRAGNRPERTLFIGDNVNTDGRGAKTARMDFAHIEHQNLDRGINSLLDGSHPDLQKGFVPS